MLLSIPVHEHLLLKIPVRVPVHEHVLLKVSFQFSRSQIALDLMRCIPS
jgi:hypothetical protein